MIYVVGIVAVVVMVVLIVPAIARVGGHISQNGTQWMTSLDGWTSSKLGFHIVDKQAYKDGAVTIGEFLKQWAGKLMPAAGKLVSTGAGLVFEVATIGLFTFYLTATSRGCSGPSSRGSSPDSRSAWAGRWTSRSSRSAATCTPGCC